MIDWQDHIRETQNSLRVLAEQTGGFRGRQPERLRQGAEADRRRDQRLLRARLLLQQSGSAQKKRRTIEIKVKTVRQVRSELQTVVYAEATPPAVKSPSNRTPSRRSIGVRRRDFLRRLLHASCYTFRRPFLIRFPCDLSNIPSARGEH